MNPTQGHPPGHQSGPNPQSARPDRGDLDLFDVIALAWSEKGFIALVFAVLFAIGAAASLTLLKPTYTSESRLLVLLENDPTPAAAGAGGAFMLPQIMQSESELLGSEAVRALALDTLGAETVLGEPVNGDAQAVAMKALRESFTVSREPNSSALIARYESPSAERSALILNAIVDAYLAYRQQILIESGASAVADRRAQADLVVAETQAELDRFLTENRLANFETDKAAAETSVSAIQDRLRTAQADRDSAAAGARALRERLENIPENIALYIDNTATGRVMDLRAERAQLLARYQDTAPPVVAIDREISAIEGLINSGGVNGLGNIRTGLNPVRQTMETDYTTRIATAESEGIRVSTLDAQLTAAQMEVARLRGLEPVYTRLAQNVTAAEEASATLAAQEAVAHARRSLGSGAADSVRVFDRASVPLDGRSMKKLGFIGAFVFAAGVAVFLGLLRAYWRAYLGGAAVRRPRRETPREQMERPHLAYPSAANDAIADLPVLARVANREA